MFFLDEKRDDEQKVPVLWYAYGRSSCDKWRVTIFIIITGRKLRLGVAEIKCIKNIT